MVGLAQKSIYNITEWNGGQEVRILVVDDDPSVLRLMERIFNGTGCYFLASPDPRQARELFRAKTFDIIFCDVKMPSESGIDFAKEVREQYPDTAIINVFPRKIRVTQRNSSYNISW
jgi:CheY-like chemotaxis protein